MYYSLLSGFSNKLCRNPACAPERPILMAKLFESTKPERSVAAAAASPSCLSDLLFQSRLRSCHGETCRRGGEAALAEEEGKGNKGRKPKRNEQRRGCSNAWMEGEGG